MDFNQLPGSHDNPSTFPLTDLRFVGPRVGNRIKSKHVQFSLSDFGNDGKKTFSKVRSLRQSVAWGESRIVPELVSDWRVVTVTREKRVIAAVSGRVRVD